MQDVVFLAFKTGCNIEKLRGIFTSYIQTFEQKNLDYGNSVKTVNFYFSEISRYLLTLIHSIHNTSKYW